jgi:UDP-glucose 4-epimerase
VDIKHNYLASYRGATVLVTGGAGAIGSNLCRALSELGAKVLVLDDLSSADAANLNGIKNCTLRVGSILDHEALHEAFSHRPRIVFHLAALFANQKSVEHPERDLMVNGLGTLRVLQLAGISGVERLVFASSSSLVSAPQPDMPIDEDCVSVDLNTPYQVTKLLGELYCNYFNKLHKLPTVRVRFFNSYGPGELPGRYRNVIPNFVYSALRREPLRITGSGEETRDWTYVGDIADGLLRVGVKEEAVGELVNLGSGKETRVIDLARRINEITGNDAGVLIGERRAWDKHSRRWASVDKAKRVLGYEPQTDLATGLVTTVKWFRDNWDHIEAKMASETRA